MVKVVDKEELMKQDMKDFSCGVEFISAFTLCATLKIFTAYERILKILICLLKSDAIKPKSFSTKTLLEVASVTLV